MEKQINNFEVRWSADDADKDDNDDDEETKPQKPHNIGNNNNNNNLNTINVKRKEPNIGRPPKLDHTHVQSS